MENLQLTALIPQDMEPAQKQLIQWCEKKLTLLNNEVSDMEASISQLATMKCATKPLKYQLSKVHKRILFFDKMKKAIEAGYTIVPNFPIQIFAIRTTSKKPAQQHTNSYWGDKTQNPKELPVGEGEYKNPFPLVERERIDIGNGKTESFSYATDWDDLEFPITMAKPEIIEATNKAMLLECFDLFGVMPATRNEDPIIIGQLVNGSKRLSFMIAWHFDTKVL
jgi:hypothetical protein